MKPESSCPWHWRFTLIVLALMMIVPFLPAHHLHPIPTFYQEILAAWLGLLALPFLLRSPPGGKPELPEIALLPLGLLVILIVQLPFNAAINTDRALIFALYLIWSTLLILLGRQLAQTLSCPTLGHWLSLALLAGSLIQALTAALQFSGSLSLPWIAPFTGQALTGNLAQPNSFACYLWLGIGSALYLRTTGHLQTGIALTAVVILLFFSAFSGSRTTWLYALALPAFTALLHRRHPECPAFKRWFQSALATLAALLLLQAALGLGLIPLPETWPGSAAVRLAETQGHDPIRTALWKTAWNIFTDHPVLGGGIGQFTWQFHQHVLQLMPMHLPGLPEHAHNLLLHLMAEMGFGAALLLIVLGGRWALGFWREIRHPVHGWLAACLLILLIHSLFEYPLWYSFFLGPFALLLGLGSSRSLPLSIHRVLPPLLAGALVLGALTLWTLQQDYRILETTLNQDFDYQDRANFQRQYNQRLQDIGRNSLLSPYAYMVMGNLQEDNAENLEDKRLVCHHALRFAATRHIVYKCAHLEALAGNTAEARLALRRALAAYPDHAPVVRQEWQHRQAGDPTLQVLLEEFPPEAAVRH